MGRGKENNFLRHTTSQGVINARANKSRSLSLQLSLAPPKTICFLFQKLKFGKRKREFRDFRLCRAWGQAVLFCVWRQMERRVVVSLLCMYVRELVHEREFGNLGRASRWQALKTLLAITGKSKLRVQIQNSRSDKISEINRQTPAKTDDSEKKFCW